MVDLLGFQKITKEGVSALPDPVLPYYVAAKEGLYLYKHTSLGKVILPYYSKGFEHLPAISGAGIGGTFWWEAPKIPRNVISQAWSFFADIYSRQQTEACLFILYNPSRTRNPYKLWCPPQVVSGTSVKWLNESPNYGDGWQAVGTIHSHCAFDSFHSGTDEMDADQFDGVHLTIGHVNTDKPDFVALVSISTTKCNYEDASLIAEIDNLRPMRYPRRWREIVVVQEVQPKTTKAATVASKVTSAFAQNRSWYDEDYQYSWAKNWSNYKPTSGIYCKSVGCYIPWDWWDIRTQDIKPEYIPQAITRQVQDLVNLAEKNGLYLVYHIGEWDDPISDEEMSVYQLRELAEEQDAQVVQLSPMTPEKSAFLNQLHDEVEEYEGN